jgi:ABC-type phosphate transport system auxiliary subunit
LENIAAKNKECAKRLKVLENDLRAVENELDRSILERDAL